MLSPLNQILPACTVWFFCCQLFLKLPYAVIITVCSIAAIEFLKASRLEENTMAQLLDGVTKIGHRACGNAPENTLEAAREAHRLGVKAIEIDVMISADGEPFVFHDETCERTTDGRGKIQSMQWSEIQKLDASFHFDKNSKYSNVRVPHLKDMLLECKRLGLKVFLDMKGSQPLLMAQLMNDMHAVFPDLHTWAVVCSFYPQTLYAVKWYAPQFMTIITHRPWLLTRNSTFGPERNEEVWKKLVAPIADVILDQAVYHFLWYFCGVDGVFREHTVISSMESEFWKARNLPVIIWTVNDQIHKQYLTSLDFPYITDDCSV